MFFEENLRESVFFEDNVAWGHVYQTDMLLRRRIVSDNETGNLDMV